MLEFRLLDEFRPFELLDAFGLLEEAVGFSVELDAFRLAFAVFAETRSL